MVKLQGKAGILPLLKKGAANVVNAIPMISIIMLNALVSFSSGGFAKS